MVRRKLNSTQILLSRVDQQWHCLIESMFQNVPKAHSECKTRQNSTKTAGSVAPGGSRGFACRCMSHRVWSEMRLKQLRDLASEKLLDSSLWKVTRAYKRWIVLNPCHHPPMRNKWQWRESHLASLRKCRLFVREPLHLSQSLNHMDCCKFLCQGFYRVQSNLLFARLDVRVVILTYDPVGSCFKVFRNIQE